MRVQLCRPRRSPIRLRYAPGAWRRLLARKHRASRRSTKPVGKLLDRLRNLMDTGAAGTGATSVADIKQRRLCAGRVVLATARRRVVP